MAPFKGGNSGRLHTLADEVVVGNTNVETDLMSWTGPAFPFAAKTELRWSLDLLVTTKAPAVGNLVLKVYVHSVLVDTITLSPTNGLSEQTAKISGNVTIRTAGTISPLASGTAVASHRGESAAVTLVPALVVGKTATAVDFNVKGTLNAGVATRVTGTWATADVANILKAEQGGMEAV
jgi:hypothetical protein